MWSIDVYDKGNFERFYLKLDDLDQAVLQAAIDHVLKFYGIDICRNEWGKNLGGGLYEFRVRRSLGAILGEFGPPGAADELSPRERARRPLLRVFCTFHGERIVLLLGGYNKRTDPSPKRQNKEIRKARKFLDIWKGDIA